MSRITVEISALAFIILDAIPEEVWRSTTTTFVDFCMGGGQIIKEVINRLRQYGHSEENIRNRVFGFETSKLYLNYAVNRHKLIGTYGVMTTEQFMQSNDKFDVVVGSPLFSRRINGKSTDIDSQYCAKAMDIGNIVLMVVRSKHFGGTKSKFRKDLFGSNRLISVSHISKSHYPNTLNTRTCLINLSGDKTESTLIKFEDGITKTQQLTSDSVIMMQDSTYAGHVENSLADRLITGKLRRKNIVDMSGGIPLIEVMGSDEEPITRYVNPTDTDIGCNTHGVIMNTCVGWGDLGKLHIKPYAAAISGSVACLTTASLEEARVLKTYLETDEVRAIVKKSMVSFHPTKELFSCIPSPF
jgi:hypothetical protein